MADNVIINTNTSVGDTIAADDIGGVKFQRIKLSLGPDGVASDSPIGNGTAATAMRVTVASDSAGTTVVTDGGGSITVDGTVSSTQSGTWNVGTVTTVTGVTTVSTVSSVAAVTPGTAATSLGKAEDAPHTSGDVGVMALGVQKAADGPLAADLDYVPPQFDANGYLKVNIKAGAAAGGTSTTDASAYTRGSSTLTPAGFLAESAAPSLVSGQIGAPSMTTAGAMRVNIASGGIAGVTEDVASAGGEEGILAMGVVQTTLASTVSATGDYTYAKFNLPGAIYTQPTAGVSGGLTGAVPVTSAASNNATSLKASAGQVYSVTASSVNAAMRYLKFYDKASAPAPATDNALLRYVFPIPGNTAGAGVTHPFPTGLSFTSGIAWALVTGSSATDNTSVGAGDHVISIGYV